MDPYLHIERLSHTYPGRGEPLEALRQVSFGAHKREFLAIVGPSGSGKTTLLKIIAGLIKPTSGRVHFAGSPPSDRPQAALVFQDHVLLPWLDVTSNVALGLEMRDLAGPDRERRAHQYIQRVGLDGFESAYPHELSVGMRQRVALARAFLSGSPVLLLDEPFAALDAQTRHILRQDLLAQWKAEQKLILYVTHDIEEAVLTGDRVLVLSGRPGRVVKSVQVNVPRQEDGLRSLTPQVREMSDTIWHLLESDVQRGLSQWNRTPEAHL